MNKTGKKIKHLRKFSEDFKLKIVKEYERGGNERTRIRKVLSDRQPNYL